MSRVRVTNIDINVQNLFCWQHQQCLNLAINLSTSMFAFQAELNIVHTYMFTQHTYKMKLKMNFP